MSIMSEIERLYNSKEAIKEAIENKGVPIYGGTIDTYAEKINQIETGITPTGNIDITENGTYDVTDKATATVNIPTGGGSQYPIIEGTGKHEVRFVDYDGTLIKVQYVNDGENATAPQLPTHDRLTFVEWNRDYTDITHDLDVGAVYRTTSGNTELFIEVTEETGLTITLNIYRSVSSGAISVNWGDGYNSEFSTGTGAKALTHNYSSYGDYMISIMSSINYGLGGHTVDKPTIKGNNEVNTFKALTKCYCGTKPNELRQYGFYNNVNLKEFTMAGITKTNMYLFCNTKQKAIILPNVNVSAGNRIATNCSILEFLILPDAMTSIPGPLITNTGVKKFIYPKNCKTSTLTYAAYNGGIEYIWYPKSSTTYAIASAFTSMSPSLKYVPIYDNLTGITTSCLSSCNIEKIAIPPSVTTIANSVLNNCGGLTDVYMYPHTPPTLGGTSSFATANSSCKIHVYPEDLEAYQNATNWSTSTLKNKLVGDLEGEFKDGYCE